MIVGLNQAELTANTLVSVLWYYGVRRFRVSGGLVKICRTSCGLVLELEFSFAT